jgi:hypothetical protein
VRKCRGEPPAYSNQCFLLLSTRTLGRRASDAQELRETIHKKLIANLPDDETGLVADRWDFGMTHQEVCSKPRVASRARLCE